MDTLERFIHSVEAHSNLGDIYYNLKHYGEAIKECKHVIRINSDSAEVYYNNMGVAYKELMSFNEAIESYKKAIMIDPYFAEPHLGLGVVYVEIGNKDSALAELNILEDLDAEKAMELSKLMDKVIN